MEETHTPPFNVGQLVIAIKDFARVRRVWKHNYPEIGEVVQVLSIKKHPIHDFWLITIPKCECELCHLSFAPIQSNFQPITFKEVIKEEIKLIGSN